MTGSSTREKLLDAALDLFSRKGYSATSVDEIAESIGIKGPNIYKYFKGKEALFSELAHVEDSDYRTKMQFEDPSLTIKTAEDLKRFTLEQFLYTVNEEKVTKLRKMCTIEQFRDPNFSEQITLHQYTNIQTLFTKIMAGLMKEGLIEKCDPAVLALMYTSPTNIMIQNCDREPSRKDEALKKIEAHIDFFIDKFFIKK